jgi:hypothetical protein
VQETTEAVLKRFESEFTEDERRLIACYVLESTLIEVPCSECGGATFTVENRLASASYECPVCHKRTFIRNSDGKRVVVSEGRLTRIVRYAQTRKWHCPQHDGVQIEITGVQPDTKDPLKLAVHYLCRRSRGFGRKRVHSGVRAEEALCLEAEMLASTDGKGAASR